MSRKLCYNVLYSYDPGVLVTFIPRGHTVLNFLDWWRVFRNKLNGWQKKKKSEIIRVVRKKKKKAKDYSITLNYVTIRGFATDFNVIISPPPSDSTFRIE